MKAETHRGKNDKRAQERQRETDRERKRKRSYIQAFFTVTVRIVVKRVRCAKVQMPVRVVVVVPPLLLPFFTVHRRPLRCVVVVACVVARVVQPVDKEPHRFQLLHRVGDVGQSAAGKARYGRTGPAGTASVPLACRHRIGTVAPAELGQAPPVAQPRPLHLARAFDYNLSPRGWINLYIYHCTVASLTNFVTTSFQRFTRFCPASNT